MNLSIKSMQDTWNRRSEARISGTDTRTRAELVYQSIRSDILAGRLHPDQKLPLADLTERYGAKMGAVREALLKLASEEHLVVSAPQVGFRVRPVSVDDLTELTEARCVLEAEVLKLSIQEGDLDWESRVIAAHHRLSRVPRMDEADPARISDAWAQAHAAFHETLLDGCINSRLRSTALAWRESAELYRRWSATPDRPDRDIDSEHRALCDAAVNREVEHAAELIREHISRTTVALVGKPSEFDFDN